MVEVADLVILEINENMPGRMGITGAHLRGRPGGGEPRAASMLAKEESTDIERMIGGHIADLIEDGPHCSLA
jgi:hypothetical protein